MRCRSSARAAAASARATSRRRPRSWPRPSAGRSSGSSSLGSRWSPRSTRATATRSGAARESPRSVAGGSTSPVPTPCSTSPCSSAPAPGWTRPTRSPGSASARSPAARTWPSPRRSRGRRRLRLAARATTCSARCSTRCAPARSRAWWTTTWRSSRSRTTPTSRSRSRCRPAMSGASRCRRRARRRATPSTARSPRSCATAASLHAGRAGCRASHTLSTVGDMAATHRHPPYFNIADPSFVIDSDEVLRAREESWYVRTNYGLAVLRYDEVSALLRDRRLKQGSAAWPAHHGVEGPFADWWSKALLNLEGDDHARLRRLLNPVFAPKAISDMAPRFRALGKELPRIDAALEGLYGFADELIADRRREPKDDFVTRLVQAEQDEDRLSHDELRVSLVLLIFGGLDTTRNQLGLAMQTFLDRPDEWRRLAERPELAEGAVEEIMRINPTVTWVTREAVEDFTFQGLEIAEGTTVHLFSQSAGSDPRVFENPGFDPEAERPRHFGFGGGRHHCIGHFVARMDMSEALALLASRLRDPRVDGEVKSLPRSGNTGPIELPIAFTACL